MDPFETTLTHDFYLQQHPYRVLLAFERFATLTHLQEWKQRQGTWDLTGEGCLLVTYVYGKELRRTQQMQGQTVLGRMASGIMAYNGRRDFEKNILFRFTFQVDFLQLQKGSIDLQVRTVTQEEIDPVPSFNHRDFAVSSSIDLVGNVGIELEKSLRF